MSSSSPSSSSSSSSSAAVQSVRTQRLLASAQAAMTHIALSLAHSLSLSEPRGFPLAQLVLAVEREYTERVRPSLAVRLVDAQDAEAALAALEAHCAHSVSSLLSQTHAQLAAEALREAQALVDEKFAAYVRCVAEDPVLADEETQRERLRERLGVAGEQALREVLWTYTHWMVSVAPPQGLGEQERHQWEWEAVLQSSAGREMVERMQAAIETKLTDAYSRRGKVQHGTAESESMCESVSVCERESSGPFAALKQALSPPQKTTTTTTNNNNNNNNNTNAKPANKRARTTASAVSMAVVDMTTSESTIPSVAVPAAESAKPSRAAAGKKTLSKALQSSEGPASSSSTAAATAAPAPAAPVSRGSKRRIAAVEVVEDEEQTANTGTAETESSPPSPAAPTAAAPRKIVAVPRQQSKPRQSLSKKQEQALLDEVREQARQQQLEAAAKAALVASQLVEKRKKKQ